jgi:drug/metabolite transporter (DMT)-like permease
MTKLVFFLLCALVIEALGVVLLSKGLKQIGEVHSYTAVEIGRLIGRGVANPWILLGTALETAFFVMLLVLLKRNDVSLIWPLTSLGFVLTALTARFINHETVSPLRWAGVALIVVGAGLVAWSEKSKERAARQGEAVNISATQPRAE